MKKMMYVIALPVLACVLSLTGATAQDAVLQLEGSRFADLPDGFDNVFVLPPKGVGKVEMIKEVQGQHIDKQHPGYRALFSLYIKDKKQRYLEIVTCINNDNERVTVYFDMSDVYKKLKAKSKESKEKIEELEGKYTVR